MKEDCYGKSEFALKLVKLIKSEEDIKVILRGEQRQGMSVSVLNLAHNIHKSKSSGKSR